MSSASSPPAVTVAMSVYNNAPYLRAAIDSILAQTFEDFEFLIVNDGSKDGSAEIIDSYAAADSRVRAIHQENRGLVASLNRLIDEARAPLIARMDGDDISMPQRFARQVAFMEANPDYGVVGTWAFGIDLKGQVYDGGASDQPTDNDSFRAAMQGDETLLCHPAVMMRSAVVRAAQGYRAQYRHCEDYDLWLRLSEQTKLCSIPERLIEYRYSSGQVSNRHVVQQAIGAAIAWYAHEERIAGRPDPTEGLAELPPVESLDGLFGRPGLARAVRDMVANEIVYSQVGLGGPGFELLLGSMRDGGARDGMWKTVARLVRFGMPGRALRLAGVLATNRQKAAA